jgi:Rieske 2Fe-2S family protein
MRDWRPTGDRELALQTVALEERYGCLFVNLASQPDPFDGDIRRQLLVRMGSDQHLACWGLETLATGRRTVYDVAANWKLIVENFSECYHCPTVHPELTSVLPEFKQGRGTLHAAGYGAAYAEGAGGFTFDGRPGLPPLPGLDPADARRYYGIVVTPNWFLNLVGDHVIMHRLEPLAPDRTRVVCDWLFPPSVLEAGLDIDPSVELFGRVNGQDFAVCEQCQLGMSSRTFAHGGVLVPVEEQLQAFHDEVRAAVGDHAGAHPSETVSKPSGNLAAPDRPARSSSP